MILARRHVMGDASRGPFSFKPTSRLAERVGDDRKLVVDVFEGLNEYDIGTDEDTYDVNACKRGGYKYLRSLSALNLMWREGVPDEQQRALPWHLRPKCHEYQHLLEEQLERWGSPRRFWCYGDEAFVGAIKEVAGRSKHPHTLEEVVMKKMQIFAGVHAWLEANPE